MIKVLVVEDSPVIRDWLVHILQSDPELEVIGTASNGEHALQAMQRLRPDVITMDIHMPKMNGFEATRRIMETHPTPIVIVSGTVDSQEVATTFRAIEAGALAVLSRPQGIGHAGYETTTRELVQTVKLMSEVKVVRRWPRSVPPVASVSKLEIMRTTADIRLVAIGASTGGPMVLEALLSGLPKDFPTPVLIVQHMAPGFVHGFAQWLSQSSGFPVRVASDGEHLLPGHAYVAPDGVHMGAGPGGRVILSQEAPESGLRPAVSYLFRSVANIYDRNAIGVLLTGMGKDGAEALKRMKEAGAITIAQDEASSVVHGMPGEAIKLDAATYVLPPDRMPAVLTGLVDKRGTSS